MYIMALRNFVGTYTRSVDDKSRVIFPRQWEQGLSEGIPFYLYKPPQLNFVALITEEHVKKYYLPLIESTPSPLEFGRDGITTPTEGLKLLESLVGWGPQEINISKRKGNVGMRLLIPDEGHFRQWLAANNAITMVGANDYITMYQGCFNSVAQMLCRK